MTNELIEGIKPIKMYAWESTFVQKIIKLCLLEHNENNYAHIENVFLRGITFFS